MKIGSSNTLSAQRYLANASQALTTSYERLSSGQRINKAADDAAGLAVSEQLSVSTRVYGRAIKNIDDGISLTNIVQGAMEQLSTITQRQIELAEQAANGVYADTQRSAARSITNPSV